MQRHLAGRSKSPATCTASASQNPTLCWWSSLCASVFIQSSGACWLANLSFALSSGDPNWRYDLIRSSLRRVLTELPILQTRFRLINRRTGKEEAVEYLTEAFFFLHTINAFEENGHVIIDICCYKNAKMLDCMYIDALKVRMIISPSSFTHLIHDVIVERSGRSKLRRTLPRQAETVRFAIESTVRSSRQFEFVRSFCL